MFQHRTNQPRGGQLGVSHQFLTDFDLICLGAQSARSCALRLGRDRSLLTKMSKPTTKKRNRVKGSASRGFFGRWKWVLISVSVLLIVPAMQVAVVRFINPPVTLPMLIEQAGGTPLRYRWIDLPQIPEMFLEHLWISAV
jgi:hypothetical protein